MLEEKKYYEEYDAWYTDEEKEERDEIEEGEAEARKCYDEIKRDEEAQRMAEWNRWEKENYPEPDPDDFPL